jgi:hypothetical protein
VVSRRKPAKKDPVRRDIPEVEIVATLSRHLAWLHFRGTHSHALSLRQTPPEREFGRGFAAKNLRRLIQFAEVFPEIEIVVSLIRQSSWTHFIALIRLSPR